MRRSSCNAAVAGHSAELGIFWMLHARFVIVVGAALLAAGCWPQPHHGSLKDPPEAARSAIPAPKACDCAQRHQDHLAGRAPCGVATLEEKEADDRRCGKLYRTPGHLETLAEEPVL
jgi:hypothetical protein